MSHWLALPALRALFSAIPSTSLPSCAALYFLFSELYPRPPCFWPAARRLPTRGLCPAVLSPHRSGGIRQSLYTWRHIGGGRVVALVLALRLGCLKRSSDSRRPLLKALLNKSQSLSGNERARVGMALAAQVVVLPLDDTEAPRVNVFLIRDVVVHQEVMFTEPVKYSIAACAKHLGHFLDGLRIDGFAHGIMKVRFGFLFDVLLCLAFTLFSRIGIESRRFRHRFSNEKVDVAGGLRTEITFDQFALHFPGQIVRKGLDQH